MQLDTANAQQYKETLVESVKENTGTTIFISALLIILGFLAIGAPFVTGLSVALLVGGLLLSSGVLQLLFAFKSKGGVLTYVMAVLNALVGFYMLANPGIALESLTLCVAIYLIVTGVSEAVVAFQLRPQQGWGWALFSALMSVLLGMMIWAQFPLSGMWMIGFLVGIKVLFSGFTLLMFALAARNEVKEVEA